MTVGWFMLSHLDLLMQSGPAWRRSSLAGLARVSFQPPFVTENPRGYKAKGYTRFWYKKSTTVVGCKVFDRGLDQLIPLSWPSCGRRPTVSFALRIHPYRTIKERPEDPSCWLKSILRTSEDICTICPVEKFRLESTGSD